ncbi:MAG: NupC/NupG family nucleoside CNT transporter [Deltaproteobacteria bacterium]|nr:NupC/NupG family nucleoside CNT transporter [Deltaproteobacteria bacterium]
MVSFWGLFVLMAMAYLLSNNRAAINVRLVISGIALQLVFALFILKTSVGAWFFNQIANTITSLLAFTDQGTAFLFGNMLTDPKTFGFIFALKVLPLIIFVSSLTAVLYYFGILQRVVGAMAWVMSRVMKTSGTESLAAAANTFVGQTEAPLFIRPYISNMTNSELMALMVGGFATIAGAVMVTYAAFIAEAGLHAGAGHLLAASVISAPAALVIAKIMFPETQASQTSGYVKIQVPITDVNALDAAARGASEGLKLAVNVAAMLLAFIAFIHLFNWMVGKGIDHALFYFGQAPIHLTLDKIFGWAFSPIAWIMGVPWRDCLQVGNLLGQKTIINEFVGYLNLVPLIKEGVISERSQIIAIYALCGFSNLSSIAIQLGGIGPLAPERRGDLAKLGLRAMIAGSIACFMTATIAGMIIK